MQAVDLKHDNATRSQGNSFIFKVANSYEFIQPHSFCSWPIHMNSHKWPTPDLTPKPTHHWCLDKSYKFAGIGRETALDNHIKIMFFFLRSKF